MTKQSQRLDRSHYLSLSITRVKEPDVLYLTSYLYIYLYLHITILYIHNQYPEPSSISSINHRNNHCHSILCLAQFSDSQVDSNHLGDLALDAARPNTSEQGHRLQLTTGFEPNFWSQTSGRISNKHIHRINHSQTQNESITTL